MSFSAHKFGGPKGVGVSTIRTGVRVDPLIVGGGQERESRSGTHNVAGIVGMVAAMEATVRDRTRFRADVTAARDGFEDALLAAIPDLVVTVPRRQRLVQHSHLRVPGIGAETLLIRLDAAGVAAAAGSACSSGAIEVSHVMTAMGFGEPAAREAVRFTFGWTSRPDDGPEAARRLVGCVEALR